MKYFLYRIYQIPYDQDSCTEDRIWIDMDCYSCESRDQLKAHIKEKWSNLDVGTFRGFAKPRKPSPGDIYCVIIGEAYEQTGAEYLSVFETTCTQCGTIIKTLPRFITHYMLTPWELKSIVGPHTLSTIAEYKDKAHFCSHHCKSMFIESEKLKNISVSDGENLFITTETFAKEAILGFIYVIKKKSTQEFYIGQTRHLPIFRWGQHLATDRFPFENITDYQFEVLEVVFKGGNLNEKEKYYIQEAYKQNPALSLNIQLVSDKLLALEENNMNTL